MREFQLEGSVLPPGQRMGIHHPANEQDHPAVIIPHHEDERVVHLEVVLAEVVVLLLLLEGGSTALGYVQERPGGKQRHILNVNGITS